MTQKIIVCIQAYNEERFIAECIRSVLAQSFGDFTLIVSDNHSTDGTAAIVESLASQDRRIVCWQPPAFCKSLEHARFIFDRVNQIDHQAMVLLGAHDLLHDRYLERLHAAYEAHPNAAIVVGSGAEIDDAGRELRAWPSVLQLIGGHVPFRPQVVLTTLFYNLAAFGLWSKRVRHAVKLRHDCMCADHLYIAEASLHGDIVVVPEAKIMTRRTIGVGSHDTYFRKHISDDMSVANIVADFDRQLEWVRHINGIAFANFPESVRNINLAGALGQQFTMFGIGTLGCIDGALEAWLNSPAGVSIASRMNNIGAVARIGA